MCRQSNTHTDLKLLGITMCLLMSNIVWNAIQHRITISKFQLSNDGRGVEANAVLLHHGASWIGVSKWNIEDVENLEP